MADEKTLLLVYGTLKKGQPQENVMTDSSNGIANWVGRGTTLEKWPLVIASKYNIPFLLKRPGIGHRISGDVFEVDSQKLSFLDRFESCPTYYDRLEIEVELFIPEGKPSIIKTFCYILPTFKPQLLERQMYSDYNSYGDHGRSFVLRSERVKEQSDDYEDTDDE
jgi:gamma-glutamylaminecyclotransferase